MSWNPAQQAMLEAMGYTVYRQAGVAAEPRAVVEAARLPYPSAARPGIADDPPVDRLLQALRRAAGDRDLANVTLPPLEQLRRSAQAKRALWPQLRALRRS